MLELGKKTPKITFSIITQVIYTSFLKTHLQNINGLLGEAFRQYKMSVKKEELIEEEKEDLDCNPFSYYRESNIYEINGNI